MLLDWTEFWQADHVTEDWLIEPLLPAGRAVSVYAPAKTGKSLIVLSAIAAACTGRSVWGLSPQPPVRILYLDYEMTPNDLRERLELLGYGPDDDLSNLRYALIPSLPPFDTAEGGQALLELAQAENVKGVIIDTFGRATQGDENDADTTRSYYRYTGGLLKKNNIASLRTDHAGKDLERGQRGSSAKNDDVDLVWKLGRTDDGIKLNRTHSRMSWVPEAIDLVRHEDQYGAWEFRRAAGSAGWPAGTKDVAAALDALGLPVDVSTRKAADALKEAGQGIRRTVVTAAVKWRKQVSETVDNPQKWFPEPLSRDRSEPASGTETENLAPPAPEPVGNHREPVGQAPWEPGSPPKGGTGPSPHLTTPLNDLI
jgi:KaiC/GvpD/RAD55 family RecA-like ATPase